jgi:molybdopterin biosynthesis enzyme
VAQAELDRMIHPDEARKIVLSHAAVLPFQQVNLVDSGDRVLAKPLVADVDLPPFNASTMDGYAVVHSDTDAQRRILGSGFAGADSGFRVTPGTASKIMTGAPVPDGATAVVMVENTETSGDIVTIHQRSMSPGENIRPVGADMRMRRRSRSGGSGDWSGRDWPAGKPRARFGNRWQAATCCHHVDRGRARRARRHTWTRTDSGF